MYSRCMRNKEWWHSLDRSIQTCIFFVARQNTKDHREIFYLRLNTELITRLLQATWVTDSDFFFFSYDMIQSHSDYGLSKSILFHN